MYDDEFLQQQTDPVFDDTEAPSYQKLAQGFADIGKARLEELNKQDRENGTNHWLQKTLMENNLLGGIKQWEGWATTPSNRPQIGWGANDWEGALQREPYLRQAISPDVQRWADKASGGVGRNSYTVLGGGGGKPDTMGGGADKSLSGHYDFTDRSLAAPGYTGQYVKSGSPFAEYNRGDFRTQGDYNAEADAREGHYDVKNHMIAAAAPTIGAVARLYGSGSPTGEAPYSFADGGGAPAIKAPARGLDPNYQPELGTADNMLQQMKRTAKNFGVPSLKVQQMGSNKWGDFDPQNPPPAGTQLRGQGGEWYRMGRDGQLEPMDTSREARRGFHTGGPGRAATKAAAGMGGADRAASVAHMNHDMIYGPRGSDYENAYQSFRNGSAREGVSTPDGRVVNEFGQVVYDPRSDQQKQELAQFMNQYLKNQGPGGMYGYFNQ